MADNTNTNNSTTLSTTWDDDHTLTWPGCRLCPCITKTHAGKKWGFRKATQDSGFEYFSEMSSIFLLAVD